MLRAYKPILHIPALSQNKRSKTTQVYIKKHLNMRCQYYTQTTVKCMFQRELKLISVFMPVAFYFLTAAI
jgi:hypothetical protein